MKGVNYLVFIILFPWLGLCQNPLLEVKLDSFDNYYYRSHFLDGGVFLSSISSIGTFSSKKDWQMENIELSGVLVDHLLPVSPILIKDGYLIMLGMTHLDRNYKFYTFSINLLSRQLRIIDSITILGPLNGFYHTKIFRHRELNNICISFINGGLPVEKIVLFKIYDSGFIRDTIELNRASANGPNTLFSHRWIHQITPISETRLVTTGSNRFVSIVDTNMNIVYRGAINKFEPKINGNITANRPELFVEDSENILAVDVFPYDVPNFYEQYIYRIKINEDSLYLDSFLVTSNAEKQTKLDPSITKGEGNYYYTVVTEGEELGTYKVNTSNYFYITKFRGLQEVWKKRYGGNYYFRVLDMMYFDTCKIIVLGSIYDYFKNGFHQGFYTVLDCEGNVLSSNVDIKQQEINVYPNPSSGIFHISMQESPEYSDVHIFVYDLNGREVLRLINHKSPHIKVDLNDFQAGPYLLKLVEGRKTYSSMIQLIK